ncbi:hypothetical protein [Amycolatopsis saalfeldensis]|uniref:hypothetical protein n=1 Tax=Amycolatopsis saalfeldensis TaxID=394193 RepID=UPI0011609B1C|nr:hypothetical protein [Amycolatopsis saalfeldensis]
MVGSAGGLVWQGPSGDYGHPGVQGAWGSFIDGVKTEVEGLVKKAEGHGDGLRTAAQKYLGADESATGEIGGLGTAIGSAAEAVGKGVEGRIGDVLGGPLGPVGGGIGRVLGSGGDLEPVDIGIRPSGFEPDPLGPVGGGMGRVFGSGGDLEPVDIGGRPSGTGPDDRPGPFGAGLGPNELNEIGIPGGGWAGGVRAHELGPDPTHVAETAETIDRDGEGPVH